MILVRHGQTQFNVVYGATRQDPGIVDPVLTEEGVRQAETAAETLRAHDLRRVLVSPYSRTLETAEIIAEALGLDVAVEPLVRERAFFKCDVGSPRSHLARRWPRFAFGDLPERWWPEPEETEDELILRCTTFRGVMAETDDWAHVLVVSHWGFIRGLTGQAVPNGTIVPFRPHDDEP